MERYSCRASQICTLQQFGHVTGSGITLFQPPSSSGFQSESVSAGPHGTAWLLSGTTLYVYDATGALVNKISTSKKSVEVTVPQLGPDGRMWFTEFTGFKLESHIVAVASNGAISRYRCKNICGTLVTGPDGKLWGSGLESSYAPFIYSVTTAGQVTEFSGTSADLFTAPKDRLFGVVGLFEIDRVSPRGQVTPFADLASLDLDQVIYYSSSSCASGSRPPRTTKRRRRRVCLRERQDRQRTVRSRSV